MLHVYCLFVCLCLHLRGEESYVLRAILGCLQEKMVSVEDQAVLATESQPIGPMVKEVKNFETGSYIKENF